MNNSYIEVDMQTLRENMASIASTLTPGTGIIPVLKDNAYGLGLVPVARVLEPLDCVRCFSVSHVSEGLELRRGGISKGILVMNSALPFQLEAGDDIVVDGVFSHFSAPESLERDEEEYARFLEGIAQLESAGVQIPFKHISCSAASERYPKFDMDAVRIGRRLYMDAPDEPLGTIKELASWRSYVAAVHEIAVFMDQCLVDVTGIDGVPGDEVTIFGYDGHGGYISSQSQALLTDALEGCGITSGLSTRVARVYVG